jgi:hypothetical protein
VNTIDPKIRPQFIISGGTAPFFKFSWKSLPVGILEIRNLEKQNKNKFQLTEARISSNQIVEAFADQHQIQFRGTITLLHEFLQSKFWEFF